MGRGGAGLWPLLERSTAAKRPQPCHGARASSTCTAPWHPPVLFQLHPRGCSSMSSAHPLAPASITGEARRPFGTVGCTTAPSDFIPSLCSVAFSISPSTVLHTACPAWQHLSCCQTAPCEPTEGLHDTGFRMRFNSCPSLSQGGTDAPTHNSRVYIKSYLAQEPSQNSVLQRCVYSYIFF